MEEIDWDNLPPTTVPESAQVRVRGFTNGEAAEKLGHVVVEYVGIMGSFFDLSLLEGVTVAVDYDAALASIDQGMDGLGSGPIDRPAMM
ncbi:hypothetical protein [Novosphingobium sp. ST904]|uniref:hypothetical protein n=1 Tax=Novosphingobium sp. ST904 TaxID=1684385 RepID=UPI001043C857|nr:hypothetical protein [Novosphingobium sp. ST904]